MRWARGCAPDLHGGGAHPVRTGPTTMRTAARYWCAPATGYATRARSRCSCSVSAQVFRLDHSPEASRNRGSATASSAWWKLSQI
jgi:hypothetical protein